MTEPKYIGGLHCPKIIPSFNGLNKAVTFELELQEVDPDFERLLSGGIDGEAPAGFHWEPVPKYDPEYDEAFCTHRLVRDDS